MAGLSAAVTQWLPAAPAEIALPPLLDAVVARGAELVAAASAGVAPTRLAVDLDALKVEVVAALGLGDAEEGHDLPPFLPVGPDPAMADVGYQVRDLVGNGSLDEGIGLLLGDLEVVADGIMASPVYRLAGGQAGQVEAGLDPLQGLFPGRPEEGFRQGEILIGRSPQPLDELKRVQCVSSRSMAR
ncbi:MAG: hypothetical protein A2514_13105 [Gammaproteobacteria bacterium RIFOXYD12_FULL_61_37]|nr:MAG: hypothetical protein A2514_13105 [Gammaproteobacteria bacterium RIFOXYD12_FULL_61_37]